MRFMRRLAAFLAPFVLLAQSGWSIPLDPEACAKLRDEHLDLARKGAKANLAKGPAWGKANLTQTGIDDVRRLIEVEEQIQFRCIVPEPPQAKAAAPKKEKAKPRTAAPGKEQVDPKKKAAKASEPQQEQNAAAAKQAKTAAPKASGQETAKSAQPSAKAPEAAPKKQPSAKAKVDDSYVPPAK